MPKDPNHPSRQDKMGTSLGNIGGESIPETEGFQVGFDSGRFPTIDEWIDGNPGVEFGERDAWQFDSWIYFVRNPHVNRIKAGFTQQHPEARLWALEIAGGCDMERLGLMRGHLGHEKLLHAKFAVDRWKSEWYADNERLRAFIRDNAMPWTRGVVLPQGVVLTDRQYDEVFWDIQDHIEAWFGQYDGKPYEPFKRPLNDRMSPEELRSPSVGLRRPSRPPSTAFALIDSYRASKRTARLSRDSAS